MDRIDGGGKSIDRSSSIGASPRAPPERKPRIELGSRRATDGARDDRDARGSPDDGSDATPTRTYDGVGRSLVEAAAAAAAAAAAEAAAAAGRPASESSAASSSETAARGRTHDARCRRRRRRGVTRLERGAARGGGRSSAVERAFARARVGKRRGSRIRETIPDRRSPDATPRPSSLRRPVCSARSKRRSVRELIRPFLAIAPPPLERSEKTENTARARLARHFRARVDASPDRAVHARRSRASSRASRTRRTPASSDALASRRALDPSRSAPEGGKEGYSIEADRTNERTIYRTIDRAIDREGDVEARVVDGSLVLHCVV